MPGLEEAKAKRRGVRLTIKEEKVQREDIGSREKQEPGLRRLGARTHPNGMRALAGPRGKAFAAGSQWRRRGSRTLIATPSRLISHHGSVQPWRPGAPGRLAPLCGLTLQALHGRQSGGAEWE